MKPENVLILPGWQNSGPDHWQSRWERTHGFTRVEQHEWVRPLRGDWISRLEDVLLSLDEPAVLVAHSLGCLHIAAWASHSQNTHRVKAALLVAPPDIEREDNRQVLPGWSPAHLQCLPFPTVLLASTNDPFCELERAQLFGSAWGAEWHDVGPMGHLNTESGLGDWPAAYNELRRLMCLSPSGTSIDQAPSGVAS